MMILKSVTDKLSLLVLDLLAQLKSPVESTTEHSDTSGAEGETELVYQISRT